MSNDIQSNSLNEVKQLKIFLQNILTTVPGSLYWKDKNGVYLGCNDTMVRTAGVASANDIIGKTDAELWPEQASVLSKNDQTVISTGQTMHVQETVKVADETLLFFAGVKAPLRDEEGNIIGVLGNSIDITELKKAKDEAEVANQAKTQFLASMSHDLRTPLQAILIMTEILQKRAKTIDLQKPLETINKAGKELMQLIEDVLSFSKLESNKQEPQLESFNLRELIEEIINLIVHSAQKKKIELVMNYSFATPEYVINDAVALRRILINLIGNAIKFTENGHVMLIVEKLNTCYDSIQLQFSVKDTGIGIPHNKLEFIFERFTRVELNKTQRQEGIGLGLAIVKELVQNLGGKIQVFSELNKGSTFIFSLPFKLPL